MHDRGNSLSSYHSQHIDQNHSFEHVLDLVLISMDHTELAAECGRLHLALSKARNKILELEEKLKSKSTRIKNLAQQVSDKEKARHKLQTIVDSLRDVENISEATAALLKVKHASNQRIVKT